MEQKKAVTEYDRKRGRRDGGGKMEQEGVSKTGRDAERKKEAAWGGGIISELR